MVCEIVAKCLHGGLQEHDCPVRVLARAATLHLRRPALEPQQVAEIGSSLGDPSARVGQRSQAEETWSALGGALACEVAHDAGHLANGALPGGHHPDDAASERETAVQKSTRVDG